MFKINFKYLSFFIILILVFNSLIPLLKIPGTSRIVKASSITGEDAYKGLGIALVLFLLTKVGNSLEGEAADTSSEDRIDLLARIIHAEARGEPYLGQVGVGAVIINRKKSPDFPDTIKEIIYQSQQFSSVQNGQINLSPDASAYKAARECIQGEDPTKGALYFYNPDTARTRDWFEENTRITTQIGNHVFAVAKENAAAVNIF